MSGEVVCERGGVGSKAGLTLEGFSGFNDSVFLWESRRSYVGWRGVWILGGQIRVDKALGNILGMGISSLLAQPGRPCRCLPPVPQLCSGWSLTGHLTGVAAALLLLQELFSGIPGEGRFQTGQLSPGV